MIKVWSVPKLSVAARILNLGSDHLSMPTVICTCPVVGQILCPEAHWADKVKQITILKTTIMFWNMCPPYNMYPPYDSICVLFWYNIICVLLIRHHICQFFYTSTFSKCLKFTRRKRANRNILNPKYYIFGVLIHRIWILSQFSYVHAHFTCYQWAKHGLILPKYVSYYVNWT